MAWARAFCAAAVSWAPASRRGPSLASCLAWSSAYSASSFSKCRSASAWRAIPRAFSILFATFAASLFSSVLSPGPARDGNGEAERHQGADQEARRTVAGEG